MEKVYATLITIGDELLIGQVIDTNSAWMAQALNEAGILVRQRISVGDMAPDIVHALEEGAAGSQVVLITGGLGPTADDITKPVLCEYFGGKLVVDAGALNNVKEIFARLNRPLIERNLKQAEVPDVCTVIQNSRGTAPGMWFEKDGVVFVSMPGVPHEMKGMMTHHVLPALQERFALPAIVHRTLLTAGVGESFLADMIQDWEQALPAHLKLAYLPNYGMVRLRISAVGQNKPALEEEVELQFRQLQQLVANYLVTNKDEPMEKVVGRMLLERKATMSTAESCTGGYIAHIITSHAGSSEYFLGSVVSYDNRVKEGLLGVDAGTLATHGAVSEAVVQQMVQGVLAATGTDYAVAVSGIMGPGGGSNEKPVGTVWMAAGSRNKTITQHMHFRFDRRRNTELTATHALNLLRRLILEESPTA
ncbi:MAG: competence/damage-inducible protein A [Chitinophagaceae bacterium]|nr:competence/damage-inducible protein A [Chitinophagaceae bacterium]